MVRGRLLHAWLLVLVGGVTPTASLTPFSKGMKTRKERYLLTKSKQTQIALTAFKMDYSQQITLQATITVNLSVPELQSKKQLNQWLMSDAARIHLIDHLKPSSFNEVKVIKAAEEVNIISQM